MVICLEHGADLHMAQLMPLPLTVSCFSKMQIGFTFLVPALPGSSGQWAVKRVCVCVCVYHIDAYMQVSKKAFNRMFTVEVVHFVYVALRITFGSTLTKFNPVTACCTEWRTSRPSDGTFYNFFS